MEEYCAAKAMLFERCDKAVINTDDFYSFHMVEKAPHHGTLTTSLTGNGDLNAVYPEYHAEGVSFEVVAGLDERWTVEVPIPGKFTVYNCMTVLGIAKQLGIPLEQATAALRTVHGVKGRIEVVPTPGKEYSILIDYAHTPDGLENVLSSVRNFCRGRLIAVFGCGGDRDPIKRPIMGRIGVENSDFAIITSDNPRTEDPQKIIDDILTGITPEMGTYTVIPERRTAIRYAMDIAKKDDIIVLAGKGHETYQEINGVKYHLDEREEVAQHLADA